MNNREKALELADAALGSIDGAIEDSRNVRLGAAVDRLMLSACDHARCEDGECDCYDIERRIDPIGFLKYPNPKNKWDTDVYENPPDDVLLSPYVKEYMEFQAAPMYTWLAGAIDNAMTDTTTFILHPSITFTSTSHNTISVPIVIWDDPIPIPLPDDDDDEDDDD